MICKNWGHRSISLVLTAMVLLLSILSPARAYAAEEKLPSGIFYTELEERVDRYVEENAKTTAGMAYAVFDGEGTIAEGYYGCADKENAVSVDEETVFEWGSASKILVWVCVMQLVEQGKIDLNTDVRQYLPEGVLTNLKCDTPVTMLHLMNHSAGFQEIYTDLMVKDADAYSSLEEALLAHQPAQIFEPGTVVAYSNWGVALAAYVVEQVSGMEYKDYVRANIFAPLGMEHTAIAMDLSDNAWVAEKRQELKSYDTSGDLLPDAFYYITLYPVGMCTSTLEDFKTLAKSLMDPDTALFKNSDTWNEFFTPTDYYGDTGVARNYHGLWMLPYGVQTIGHGGNTQGCSSYLLMDIENGIGTVVMTNQANEEIYNEDMMELIYGQYTDYKYDMDKGEPEGIYKSARTIKVGPAKIVSLSYKGDLNEKDVFYAYTDNTGITKIEYPYVDMYQIPATEMVFEVGLVGALILAFAVTLVIMLVRGIKAIIRKIRKAPSSNGIAAIPASFLTELLILAFAAYGIVGIAEMKLAVTYQWAFALVGALTLALCGLVVLGGYKTFTAKQMTRGYKAANTVMLLGGALMAVNVFYWNLFMFWQL